MGSMLGGTTSTTNTKQKTDMGPWGPQQGYLTDAFSQAKKNLAQLNAAGAYSNEFVADPNATQRTSADQAGAWATGPGALSAYLMNQNGIGLMPNVSQGGANASNWATNGSAPSDPSMRGVLSGYAGGGSLSNSGSPELRGALSKAALAGTQRLGGYAGATGQAIGSALSNPTQQLAADAGTYMNSAPIQAAIDGVNATVDRTLTEQTLPGLNRQASMGGVLNSSRAGMGEAMANRDAATVKANAAAGILNNAWNSGLSTASQQRTSGINSALAGAGAGFNQEASLGTSQGTLDQQQGQFDTTSRLGAASGALSNDLGVSSNNNQFQLGANGQLIQTGNTGFAAPTAAGNTAAQNFMLGTNAGAAGQTYDQAALDDAFKQWQMKSQYPNAALQDYMKIVGSNSWGQKGTVDTKSTTSTSSSPGIVGGILGGLSTLGGIASGGLGGIGGLTSMFQPGGMFGGASPTSLSSSVGGNYAVGQPSYGY